MTKDFKAIHKKAAEIVKNDPMLAYAIANHLRKSVIGKKADDVQYDIIVKILSSAWNRMLDIEPYKQDVKYPSLIIDLVSDTMVTIYEVLTERLPEVRK